MRLKVKDLQDILDKLKYVNYKWWKKQTSFTPLKSEVVCNYEMHVGISPKRNPNLVNCQEKLNILKDLKIYDPNEDIQFNHLLAINEEIIEYLIDDISGKNGKDELVDILIFVHLYMEKYCKEELDEVMGTIMGDINDIYEASSSFDYWFKWITTDTEFEDLYTLYLFCLTNVSSQDLIDKINYNNIRADHKDYKAYV